MFIDRRYVALLLVLISFGFVLVKTRGLANNGNFEIELFQQKITLENLDSPRSDRYSNRFYTPNLIFPEYEKFTHKDIGPLGYEENFVMIAKGRFEVLSKEPLAVTFHVKADDGFMLKVDEQELMHYPEQQSFEENTFEVVLSPGEHALHLEYFQANENAGLEVRYEVGGLKYPAGESSKYVKFEAIKD